MSTQKQIAYKLEQLMETRVPGVIPLLEGSDWQEHSTARFTGWPSADNPYALPAPFDAPDEEITILHLAPAS